jgi:hypothetical protein
MEKTCTYRDSNCDSSAVQPAANGCEVKTTKFTFMAYDKPEEVSDVRYLVQLRGNETSMYVCEIDAGYSTVTPDPTHDVTSSPTRLMLTVNKRKSTAVLKPVFLVASHPTLMISYHIYAFHCQSPLPPCLFHTSHSQRSSFVNCPHGAIHSEKEK